MMRLSTLALLLCASSCGSGRLTAEPRVVPADAQRICTTTYDPLAGLSLPRPFTYVAIRADNGPLDAGAPDPGKPDTTLFERGTPCVDASDRAACEASLATMHASGLMTMGGRRAYVVAMLRDDVVVYESTDDLVKLLGPIDTANEAVLDVALRGWDIDCGTTRVSSSDAGWRVYVHASYGDCSGPYDSFTIDASGATSLGGEVTTDGC